MLGGKVTRKVLVGVLLFVLVVFLAAGCGKKQAGNEDQESSAVPVVTASAGNGALDTRDVVSGKLEALASAKVVPSGTGGKVAGVRVDIGSRVQAGQVVVVLENDMQAASLNEARARVNMARTAFKIASDNYERGKQLLAQGAIAQATFDIQYEQVYEQARQGLAQAEAGLNMAAESYEYTIIKSPISGIVTARNVNPGEMASPGVPVVTVVNLDKVVVQATVAEDLINKIKQGQVVDVLVEAVSATPFKGVVTNIAPAADPVSKAFPIKIQIDNPDHVLKPGMFAEVQLTGERKEALLVPREAVVKSNGRDIVWVVQDGKAASRPVTTGDSDGEKIEIKTGLKAGERVVVSGQDMLRENARVEVKK